MHRFPQARATPDVTLQRRRLVPSRSGPRTARLSVERNYIELFSEVHLATTLLPTAPMTAIAATTIRPAISAYSSTSPPFSSLTNLVKRFFITRLPKDTHGPDQ